MRVSELPVKGTGVPVPVTDRSEKDFMIKIGDTQTGETLFDEIVSENTRS